MNETTGLNIKLDIHVFTLNSYNFIRYQRNIIGVTRLVGLARKYIV